MNIGIDISQIVYQNTGIARFTEGLVNAVLEYDAAQKNTWVFFCAAFRQKLPYQLRHRILASKHRLVEVPIPPTLLSWMWNDLHHVSVEKIIGPIDWFISSDWTQAPSRCRKATIVHDLVIERYPETVDPLILKTQRKRLQHVKQEADLIITDSLSSQNDISSFLSIPQNKIKVIYPGVQIDRPTNADINKTMDTYMIKQPFILTVGKIEPRKNLLRLIEAYQMFIQNAQLKNGQLPDLYIVGPHGWQNLPILPPSVHLLHNLSDTQLYALYSKALFFIFPSLWEGFGYPLIEAMQLNCPTACSQTSSLAELGEGVSLLFDPESVKQIAHALQQMTFDSDLRQKLQKSASQKAMKLTWQSYYQQLTECLYN